MTSIPQDSSAIPDNIEYGMITIQFDSPLSGMSKGRGWVATILTVNVLQLKTKAGQGIVIGEVVRRGEGHHEGVVRKEPIGRVRSLKSIVGPGR